MASQRFGPDSCTRRTFLAAFFITREPHYRDVGEAVLDYLCLYQQSWTNPVLEGLTGHSMLLGGFTSQNSDAEWSDARQSLAGTVLMDYYRATGKRIPRAWRIRAACSVSDISLRKLGPRGIWTEGGC